MQAGLSVREDISDGRLPAADRLRIAHVVEAAAGGTGRHVVDLTRGLVDRGHEVLVVYSPVRAEAKFVEKLRSLSNVRLMPLPFRRELGFHDLGQLRQLAAMLAGSGPIDVVHGHSSKAGALVRLLPRSVAAARVYTPHAVRTMDPTLSAGKRAFYSLIERLLSLRSGPIVAGSADEVSALKRIGVSTDRVEFLSFGIPRDVRLTREKVRVELGLGAEEAIIGFVGRLTPQKAPERAIRALAKMSRSDIRLVLVGDGEMDAARSVAAAEGVAHRTVFLGMRDGERVMPAFDILMVPSRYDSSPYVLLEAIMAGVPIVATPIGMAAELLADGRAGLLVPNTDDPHVWAEAITELLEPGPNQKARLAVHALQGRRSLSSMVREMETIYHRAIDDAAARS